MNVLLYPFKVWHADDAEQAFSTSRKNNQQIRKVVDSRVYYDKCFPSRVRTFTVPHRFITIDFIDVLPRNNLVSTNLRPYTSPEKPVEDSSKKCADTSDGENEVRVLIRILHAIGRDEGYNGQEDVGNGVGGTDGKEGVLGEKPVLTLLVLEIDETRYDEAVDAYSRVGVEIDNKVVGQAGERRHKDDGGDDLVEEEDSSRGVKGFG